MGLFIDKWENHFWVFDKNIFWILFKRKKKHTDGSKDENVFDIMQGVSINIFIKEKNKTVKN